MRAKLFSRNTSAPVAGLSPEALEFAPGLLSIQESPPARLPRVVMYLVATLFGSLLLWAMFGELDIVASAEGRLVPQTYVKIVQPADGGIVQEILVKEGQHVSAGQILMRMDTRDARADETTLRAQLSLCSLQLRRIEAELGNKPLARQPDDSEDIYRQVEAQYREHRQLYLDGKAEAEAASRKAQRDVETGQEVLAKLRAVAPLVKQQADAFADLAKDGYVAQVRMHEKLREHLEKERDLQAQVSTVASLKAAEVAAGKQAAQLTSKYRSELQNERIEAESQFRKFQQDWVKQERRIGLLELKASQSGIVKDLATHTTGTVVSPGTVLLTIVPDNEPLIAEVMVRNDDVGFVYPQQKVKMKLASYPFQQYGMLDGEVMTIGADSSDGDASTQSSDKDYGNKPSRPSIYKALISLKAQQLEARNVSHRLVPGMQVVAEINEGQHTVMEYLLSPLQKTIRESGHER